MRLRNIPRAESTLQAHELVIKHPEEQKGKWCSLFGNSNPIEIEIGMGKGQFLLNMAKAHPDINYIGIERYSSVLLRAVVRGLEERVTGNLRDEGDGHAVHRALAFGKSGGAQRQSHAQHEKHRQDLFHVWVPPTFFYLSQEVLDSAP